MATERIEVDIVLDDGSIKKAFVNIEQGAKVFGEKTGKAVETGLTKGFSNATSLIRSNLAVIASSFAGLTLIRKVTNDFIAFETALAEVKTVLPDVSQANDELTNSFINLSAQFGTSASDQANAFYQIVSAGITDAANASAALEQANKLAIGGLTSTSNAIDILTSSINAFGEENLTAERAADIIFGTVRLGKTNVDQLSSSLGLILPSAKALGVGFEDINGTLAALTTRGVSTSIAVTQLNSVLTAVLKNQDAAKKLGPEVAKAFSLQSLQSKGLAKFLKDLNFELGGSEQALTQVLGRAEAARAVLTLAGDNFKSASNNVEELKNSLGAADAAFQLVNQTTGQQSAQAFSKLSAIFLKLTTSSSGAIFGIARFLNESLASILANFDAFANGIAVITQKLVAGFIALKVAPIAFNAARRSLRFLQDEYILFSVRVQTARLSFNRFKTSLKTLSFRGAIASFKRFSVALKSARIGLKLVRVAAKLTKASLTLGIGLAIDFLIEKFFELQESFGGTANFFKFVVLTIRKSINELVIGFIEFIRQIERLPIIGDKIKGSIGPTFDAIQNDAVNSLNEIEESFDSLAEKAAKAQGLIPEPRSPRLPQAPGVDAVEGPAFDEAQFEANRKRTEDALKGQTKTTKDEAKKQIDITEAAWSRIAGIIGFKSQEIAFTQAQLEATATASFKNIAKAAVEGFARSFSAIGSAIVKGENAFAAFGKSILGVLGDVAIQAGTLYTLLGIASFNPQQVAAGIGLSILGGVLKALAGGGSSAPSVSPGGGLDSNPIDGNISPITQPTGVGSQVAVNIQGDVLDSTDTGLRIAEILKEQGFQNAVVSS